MTTELEKEVLREAGRIIARELVAGREVRIPSFGKFYPSELHVLEVHPMLDPSHPHWDRKDALRIVPRFKQFGALKAQLAAVAFKKEKGRLRETPLQRRLDDLRNKALDR